MQIGFPGTLFIVFLVLKLTNTIDWSWWWVTSPLWIVAGLYVLVGGAIGVVAGIASVIRARDARSRAKRVQDRRNARYNRTYY